MFCQIDNSNSNLFQENSLSLSSRPRDCDNLTMSTNNKVFTSGCCLTAGEIGRVATPHLTDLGFLVSFSAISDYLDNKLLILISIEFYDNRQQGSQRIRGV